jgi:hypothetical protein
MDGRGPTPIASREQPADIGGQNGRAPAFKFRTRNIAVIRLINGGFQKRDKYSQSPKYRDGS